MSDVRISVSEIFGPTLQGEGAHAGRPAIFIRTAGCDSRCEWCDTPYAKTTDGCRMLHVEEILQEVEALSKTCSLIIITGGNPAIQNLAYLVARLKSARKEIHIETQGTRIPFWFDRADLVTICPKIRTPEDIPKVHNAITKARDLSPIQLKYVVFTESDYQTARELAMGWKNVPFVFQPGWDPKTNTYPFGLAELANRVAKDSFLPSNVRFMPQLHRILWGGIRGI